MNPLENFEFSQSSLQDFSNCCRRFQLRYVQRLAWPAQQAEPARENERQIQRGDRFHRLAQQYLVGVPEAALTRMAQADPDEHVTHWWQNFLACIPGEMQGRQHVEVGLEAPLDDYRLVAKYDLILLRGEHAVIYDWKTSTRRPTRARLMERLQTRVYPYLLARAGAALCPAHPIAPDRIEMIYWFAEPGQGMERILYSQEQFEADHDYLTSMVREISALAEQYCATKQDFAMCAGDQGCRFCVYRSLCDRGTAAGPLEEAEDEQASSPGSLSFDLEQIGEIAF